VKREKENSFTKKTTTREQGKPKQKCELLRKKEKSVIRKWERLNYYG